MPISRNYKCIFIHIPRTGGSSVEESIGCKGKWEEENHAIFFGEIRSPQTKRLKLTSNSLQHLTMADLSLLLPKRISQQYFKFSFVRNPWDRLVSICFHNSGINRNRLAFEEFVCNLHKHQHIHLLEQYKFLTDKENNTIVDYIGRYEKLKNDFHEVCKIIGIPALELPVTNTSKHEHYRSYYNTKTKKIVDEIYKEDIRRFGYEF